MGKVYAKKSLKLRSNIFFNFSNNIFTLSNISSLFCELSRFLSVVSNFVKKYDTPFLLLLNLKLFLLLLKPYIIIKKKHFYNLYL
jgi:hypothetical protein